MDAWPSMANQLLTNASGWRWRRSFGHIQDAVRWLNQHGYTAGPLTTYDRDGTAAPIGVRRGAESIAALHWMTEDEAEQLDGLIVRGDIMLGDVAVVMNTDPETLRLREGVQEALRLCTADTGMDGAADINIRLARVQTALQRLLA